MGLFRKWQPTPKNLAEWIHLPDPQAGRWCNYHDCMSKDTKHIYTVTLCRKHARRLYATLHKVFDQEEAD